MRNRCTRKKLKKIYVYIWERERERDRETESTEEHIFTKKKKSIRNPFHNRSLIVYASISRARPTLLPPLVTFAQSMLNDRVNMTFSSSFCCRLKPSWRSVLNLQRNVDPSSMLHFAATPRVHCWMPPFLARIPLIAASQSGHTWNNSKKYTISSRLLAARLKYCRKTVLFDISSRSVATDILLFVEKLQKSKI